MSTIIEDLRVILDPLAANGAWYGVNTTEPPVYPYIVFQRISSVPNVSIAGPSVLQNTRFQIDIYSRQISEATGIETALEAAMTAWSVTNIPLTSQDIYEDDVRAYRISKDYSVWSVN
jgi:hypothetical protein